ncbi:MAG: ATP-dependent DNA helicase RecG, partial [Verrucomicrobia bacterium]
GFVIAEVDLRLRGPGNVLGTAQSGMAEMKFADFLADPTLLREARALADQVIARDPQLNREHAALRSLIGEATDLRDHRD